METTVLLGIGALLCGWAFKAGKRQGSKKGYHVGRKHANRKKPRRKKSGFWR
jgi:hypothetical protein